MTNASEFLEAVRRGRPKVAGDPESVEDYWARHESIWLADLQALRAAIRGWLQPLTDVGAVTVSDDEVAISEPDLGHYLAPALAIEVLSEPPRRVDLRPRGARIVGVVDTGGARVVGASGRVDLECELRREIILRFRDDGVTRWFTFAGGKKAEVDEGAFFEILSRVTNIQPTDDP